MELSTWLAFFAASWAISISPGAGAIAAMSAGLNHGFRRGYFTSFGLVLGIWTQVIVVGVGLGALVGGQIVGRDGNGHLTHYWMAALLGGGIAGGRRQPFKLCAGQQTEASWPSASLSK